jgi:hypothetical protein
MRQMVEPMEFNSSVIDGIFFHGAFDIPSYCLVPPHGSPPCTDNFTWNFQDQIAVGAATLQHWDSVLGEMAAKNKGVVLASLPSSRFIEYFKSVVNLQSMLRSTIASS